MNDTQQVNSKVPPVPLATEALHDRSASPSSDTTAHAARVDGEKGASGVVGGDRPMDHGDVEKGGEIAKKPATPPDFPEGGLWGWLCVLGATLVRE